MTQAEYYDRYWSPAGFNPVTGPYRALVALLEPYAAGSAECLDVGCGDGGTIGTWLAANVHSYLGVDISERSVRAARANGLDARVIADSSSLPFDDASFDLITCTEVLEHLLEPHLAAREMARLLRPGGHLVITVPNAAHWRNRIDLAVFGRWNPRGDDLSAEEPWRDPHIRFFTARALKRMLESAGLEVEAVGGQSEVGPVHSVPLLRRFSRRAEPGRLAAWLDRFFPAVAAIRLHAVVTARSETIPR